MRKLILPLVMALSLCSCKNNADLFNGEYSFKTSGNIQLSMNDGRLKDFELTDELGTLQIERLYKDSNDSVIILKNVFGGGVEVVKAAAYGDSLVLSPYTKTMEIVLNEAADHPATLDVYRADVMVSGNGYMYGNCIVIHEKYDGILFADGMEAGTLDSGDIVTVARRNE